MVSSILFCGYIVYSVFVVIIFVDLFRFLTSGKVAREVVGGPRGPIVIIVEVIQCKVE